MRYVASRTIKWGVVLILISVAVSYGADTKIPDFTKGEELVPPRKNKMLARALGPTGLWGLMYSASMKHGATRDTRQFLISKVEPGSPAAAKIKEGDVIIGVYSKKFTDDARKQLAAAINRAEAEGGILSLLVWRAGKVGRVELKLAVLGAYRESSPYDCEQTDAIIETLSQHAKTLIIPPQKREKGQSGLTFPWLSALGLLATGREDLMPKVEAFAHWLCVDDRSGEPITFDVSTQGKRVWHTAYKLIFLSEYYMATGDAYVLPAIKTLAVGAAMGQSGVGTYGHRFSSRTPDGGYHGPLLGYGAMNNAGLSMMTGLLLARRAGVEHPEIDAAILRGKRYFDFFVEHGCIPYGDHWAGYDAFDNNGVCGLAAIMYGLMGDDRGQQFFSSMIVASAPTGREEGHQGCYWTHLWGELGSARSGTEGLNAATKESRYLRTLERGWNGQVIDPSNIGPTKYGSRGDVTGERLLLLSLGRKTLYVTGKDLKVTSPLKGRDLNDTIDAGHLIYNEARRKALSEDEIFRLLASKLPPTRMTVAIAMQEQDLNRVGKLIRLLNSDNRFARYGACSAFSKAGFNSPQAVEALTKRIQEDEDILLRYFAVDALASAGHWRKKGYGLRDVAAPAVPVLLEIASKPVPNDPRGHLHWRISEALFYNRPHLTESLPDDGTRDDLIVAGVKQFLLNENGRARSMVPFDKLTDEQLEPLWGDIVDAARRRAPSGIMFSTGVMDKGMTVLAKHRIKEGLDLMQELSASYLQIPYSNELARWVPWFAKTMFKVLPEYGQHAESVVAVVEQWPVLKGRGAELAKTLPDLKKQIQDAGKPPLKHIAK